MTILRLLLLLPYLISTSEGHPVYIHKNGTTEDLHFFRENGPVHTVEEVIDLVVDHYLLFFITLAFANIVVMFFISQILYGKRGTEEEEEDSVSEMSDSVSESSDSEEEEFKYESQYFDKLEEMPNKELTPEELKIVAGQVLIEETPKGIIHMLYNTETRVFDYYTDKFADISYEILDTVARLFAVTYNCKQLCVNYREEIQNGENRMFSEMEFDKMQKEKEQLNKDNSKERSVFAIFKSYNKKGSNTGGKKYYIITEKANRFKYKGKLKDYEKTLAKAGENAVKSHMKLSYSEFKKLQPTKCDPTKCDPTKCDPTKCDPTKCDPTIRDFFNPI